MKRMFQFEMQNEVLNEALNSFESTEFFSKEVQLQRFLDLFVDQS